MDLLHTFLDFFLHLDRHLGDLITQYGTWTYAVLALIVFCETGLVVTPFLPGDSLLFAAGTFAAIGSLDPWLLGVIIFCAALTGDNLNYWIGRWIGPRAFSGRVRFLKREHLDRTHAFYERHGALTVILARFVPIVRTFTPFVAGVGSMAYPRFVLFSVVGAALWVGGFVTLGFFFGNLPVVRENFTVVTLAIVALSTLPMFVELLRARRRTGR